MTEDDLKKYLGIREQDWDRKIRPEILEAMKDIPMPHECTYDAQLPPLQALLRAMNGSQNVWIPEVTPGEHVSLLCKLMRDKPHNPCSGTCDGHGTGALCGIKCGCGCHV